jgi:hypothetical protein
MELKLVFNCFYFPESLLTMFVDTRNTVMPSTPLTSVTGRNSQPNNTGTLDKI